ncbi:hypothetical protein CBX59_001755 [Salmonella enterica]|nr:hypothetical protein [Salmonella enterica]
MKERGMIFNAEMVRAIIEGRKTQTRRPVKSVRPDNCLTIHPETATRNGVHTHVMDAPKHGLCPFGVVGDRIWVRETWATLGNEDGCCVDWDDELCKGDEKSAARIYRASCEQRPGDYGLWSIPDNADWKPHTENQKFEGAWRPSIHMPRWASRLTLEITGVRVERLNAISEEDAQAEGVQSACYEITPPEAAYRVGFGEVWRGIYGEESWAANPWVWVIKFKRVEGGAA